MGGKTGTTTQTVKIPKNIMDRYDAINKRAEDVANTPFKKFGTSPEDFVAQLNDQQKTGMTGMDQYANAAQPVLNEVQQGYTPEGFSQGVKGYMNPYLENAVNATREQLTNVANQQQSAMKGSAIGQGAFGGDRANIGLGNLVNQQNLALGQTIGGMEAQGFQDASRNYLTGLGQRGLTALEAQKAGLEGASARIGAGTLGQQTQQTGKNALYSQFQQEQSFPFQVAQFLANIGMGTGQLSGSTTTTTQPMGFFSDRRLKTDIRHIGDTHDGQPIYKYKYKGDPEEQTHIGLMAQEVEKHHPEAVGVAAGFKTVDYDKATKDSESAGGVVSPSNGRENYAVGGGLPYGSPLSINIPLEPPQIKGLSLPGAPPKIGGGLEEAANNASNISSLMKNGKAAYDWYQGLNPEPSAAQVAGGSGDYLGKVPRATGGVIPYGDEEETGKKDEFKLDIPDQTPSGGLQKPGQSPSAPQGVGNDLMNALSLAKTGTSMYQTIAPMVSSAMAPAAAATAGEIAAAPLAAAAAPAAAAGTAAAGAGIGATLASAAGTAMSWLPALFMLSDERAKDGIENIGTTFDGQKIVKFNYKGSPQKLIGLIAQDVEKHHPDAVKVIQGLKSVDYDRATAKSAEIGKRRATGGVAGRHAYQTDGAVTLPEYGSDDNLILPKEEIKVQTPEPVVDLAKEVMSPEKTDTPSIVEPTFDNILKVSKAATKKIESGGDYSIIGQPVKRKNGVVDRALGAYQVMESNLPSWTKEALGKSLTADEFLNSPEAQDKVFEHHFGKNLKAYGNPLDAASIWFTGKPVAQAGNVKDVLGTTAPKYISMFKNASGLGGADATNVNNASGLGGADASMIMAQVTPTTATDAVDAGVATRLPDVVRDTAPSGTDNGVAAGAAPSSGGLGGFGDMISGLLPQSTEGKMSLLAGVFGMLASKSPFLLQAIGEGGSAGLKTYEDLTKLKSETLKNTLGIINERFTTVDGVNYFDKMTGQQIPRAQYETIVRNALAQSGIGGSNMLAATSPTNTPTADKAVSIAKAVPTAPLVTPEVKTEVKPEVKPVPVVVPPVAEDAPKKPVVLPAVPEDSSTKVSVPKVEPKNAAEIKANLYNNTEFWKDKPDIVNPRYWSAQAEEQSVIAKSAQEQAAINANIPGAAERFKSQAEAARALAAQYRERATKTLDDAAEAEILDFNERNKLSRETTEVNPTLTGPTKVITKLEQLQLTKDGQPQIVKQNPELAAKMAKIYEEERLMDGQATGRVTVRQRVNGIRDVLERYPTGRFAEEKGNIIGYLNSLGFNIPETGGLSPSNFDELTKLTYGQIIAQMKDVASRFTNAEMVNIGKMVNAPNVMPDANAKIWAQTAALLDYDDKHYNDYLEWRTKNRDDPYPEVWNQKWRLDPNNNLERMTKEKNNDIAPAGMTLPKSTTQLVHAKKYNFPADPKRKTFPEGGIMYWDHSKGQFVKTKPPAEESK